VPDATPRGALRQKRKEATRQEILAAAVALFEAQGLQQLTIRSLAAKVKYSPMALYAYFPGKDDLIREVVGVLFTQLGARLAEAAARTSPADQIRAVSDAYLAFAAENPGRYQMLFGAATGPVPAMPGQAAYNVLLQCVEQKLPEGRRTDAKIQRVALALWAGLHGLASLSLAMPDAPFETAGVTQALTGAILRGFLIQSD